jgi:hypothetical protein
LLVTGREVDDMVRVLPSLDLFDLAVLENGAVLYDPHTAEATLLAAPPPERFFETLSRRAVPFSRGRIIASTVEPHEHRMLDAIRDLGLELEVIFNKGSAMVLPAGINKATGLRAACDRLGIAPGEVVGIGDAENDHAFLRACGIGVAVSNALPSLQSDADYVTRARAGDGVAEFIDEHLLEDCVRVPRRRTDSAR